MGSILSLQQIPPYWLKIRVLPAGTVTVLKSTASSISITSQIAPKYKVGLTDVSIDLMIAPFQIFMFRIISWKWQKFPPSKSLILQQKSKQDTQHQLTGNNSLGEGFIRWFCCWFLSRDHSQAMCSCSAANLFCTLQLPR